MKRDDANFAIIARAVAERPTTQRQVLNFLELMEAGTWVSSLVEEMVQASHNVGAAEFASDPNYVLSHVESCVVNFREDVQRAMEMRRTYPRVFDNEAAWCATQGREASITAMRAAADDEADAA
jgi:hypothetical protein